MIRITRRTLLASAMAVSAAGFVSPLHAQSGDVTISHYFTGELGLKAFGEQIKRYEEASGYTLKDSPVGHEDYKTDILVRASGNSLPDVFSYWAGARVQFIADSGALHPIDDMWDRAGLSDVIAGAIAASATKYNDHRYLVPFNYHYAGVFYNKAVLENAGVSDMPTDWNGFLALCEKLKAAGVAPIALGSANRWPAQFWFDYLLLRTAGPEYRARLMAGEASYDDPEVQRAMGMWKDLTDKGYFTENANADTWTDASDKVARGDAAMTLMGTWITGYWNGLGLVPGEDYDFFAFPVIDDGLPVTSVGPVDGLVIAANAANPEGAEAFLEFMVSNTDVQADWSKAQGALSANVNVDPSNYNPVMLKAFNTVDKSEVFAFNYDLATPPPVAEVGLSMFARFMDDPNKVTDILSQAATDAKAAFEQQ
ncbi:putative sugar-binding periplasmic protein precursor (plasmid) [Labrenzia sp. THAF191b]|uniref:ABC transporter substrate-binding protein n=1 Tax=unclassified Labrenzia TaxID=2648686 RepID=UPI0012695AFE|nr:MULTISPECIES: extracellular solute-binding protein [unclassified Labrenzia]QFT01659.1 putative sugar-binding periplasmic protein precursor [Labrenzia sp. THAF191b]QFT07864.1 putative sugar-binding periplasmic protein precursor [Labrenzia sp. THAF191a]QFT19270.1 putative sugar-binding periplasmic protein precursor [Labrenzia sp. THAF187b]